MPILDVLAVFPRAAQIMAEYGLHCFSCVYGGIETLEEGCETHGFSSELTCELLDDLNRAFLVGPRNEAPPKITPAAQKALKAIAEKDRLSSVGLSIEPDGRGGFCMELKTKAGKSERTIEARTKHAPVFFLSPLVLQRVGRATVDFRDGGFHLDFPG